MFLTRGAAAVGCASVDAALDGEQRRDPLQGRERNRRGGGVMHVVELAANVAPASHLDQRRRPRRSCRPVEAIEPCVAVGMQEATAGAEQRFGVDALAVGRVAIERGGWHIRTPRALVTHHDP